MIFEKFLKISNSNLDFQTEKLENQIEIFLTLTNIRDQGSRDNRLMLKSSSIRTKTLLPGKNVKFQIEIFFKN